MKFISSTLALLLAVAPVAVQSHTTEIRYCITPSFYLRVFVEHWHGFQSEASEAASGTLEITNNIAGTKTNALATGVLNQVTPGTLEDVGGCMPGTMEDVQSCNNPHGDWAYFDLAMTECETAVSFTFDKPSSQLYEEACPAIFPSTVTGTGFECPDFDVSNNSVTTGKQTEAESLATRWSMSDPNISYDSASNTFTVDYIDAFETQLDMQEEFYDVNCKDDGSGFPEYVVRQYFTDPSDSNKRPKMTINTDLGRPELKFKIDTAAMAKDRNIYEIAGEVNDSCMGQYYDLTATITVNAANAIIVDNYFKAGASFPFTFNVVRKGDGEVLYSSGDIPVSFSTGTLPVAFKQYTVTKRIQNLCRATDYEFVLTREAGNNDFFPTIAVSYDSPGTDHWFNAGVFEWSHDQPFPNPNLANFPDDLMFQKSSSLTEYSFTEEMNLELNPQNPVTDLTGKEGKGMMKFCVRAGIGYPEEDAQYDMNDSLQSLAYVLANGYQEVNFIESLITIFYDLTAGFKLDDFNVDPKERVETTEAKEAYSLEAWLCVPGSTGADMETRFEGLKAPIAISNNFLAGATNTPEYFNQGALITVCVAPVEAAYADGIRMDGITDFDWLRNDFGTAFTNNANSLPTDAVTQEAIEAGQASGNLLTSYIKTDCEGGKDYCRFSSILFADFYITTGVVSGSGNAKLAFGNRRLGEARRQLQADEGGESPFDLQVPVDINDTGPAGLKTAAGVSFATTSTFTIMAVALIGAALLA